MRFLPSSSVLVRALVAACIASASIPLALSFAKPIARPTASAPAGTLPALAAAPQSSAEQALHNSLKTATGNWAFTINSITVSTVGQVTAANEVSMETMVTQQSNYPKLADTNPTQLDVGLISSDPTITTAQIAAYQAGVAARLAVGDTILKVTWRSATAGSFETFGVVDANNSVRYETFLWTIPVAWPTTFADGTGDTPGPGQKRDDWSWQQTNGFGMNAAFFECSAVATCEGGTLVHCDCEHSAIGQCFGWEANGTCTSTSVGNCCHSKCELGYASGFKSVKVKAGGIGVEISGSLGCGASFSVTRMACCGAK